MNHQPTNEKEDAVIADALRILESRIRQRGPELTTVENIRAYLLLRYALLDTEHFGCIFLDAGRAVIAHKILFHGTVNYCAVLPREIAREALLHNASYIVAVHNHPAHGEEPTVSDVNMTRSFSDILRPLDIVLLDHMIVAASSVVSMRSKGYVY
jgi:DNA repair protein RadC